MIDQTALRAYIRSGDFLEPLRLPAGTELALSPLGQGEYNLNYSFLHPETGQRLVLRLNTGSQMHLDRQIEYEFSALQALLPSGRTPRPLFCDGSRSILLYGVLVMEWLPGRALRYETDLETAAEILSDIHALPVPPDCALLSPASPARSIYEECLAMAERYLTWDRADPTAARLLEALIREIGQLPLDSGGGPRCMVNTELNSGNFLINEETRSYLVDWEKPLISEAAQDLAHFLAPTTTFWKTDTILDREAAGRFLRAYRRAVNGRFDTGALAHRLPLFFTVTCLRGVSWCAMALREYEEPGRALTNPDTLRKIRAYLSEDFLRHILENYVRRDFLRGVVS